MSMQTLELPLPVSAAIRDQQISRERQGEELPHNPATLQHSPAAINQAARIHVARARVRAARARMEAEKAEARALGVEVVDRRMTPDRRWTEKEDEVIRTLSSLRVRDIQKKLPHRSVEAIEHRRNDLGLGQERNYWSPQELKIIQEYAIKSSMEELCRLLPKRSAQQIQAKCQKLHIRRGAPPLLPTGNWLCDEIRDRCRVLGYSAVDLDAMAKTGTYFQMRSWKQKAGHLWHPMVKAAKLLGGELRVEWPD